MPVAFISRFLHSEKIRFAAVGVINTVTDFGILFILVSLLNVPVILANVVSTSAALAVSYLLNKKAVFGDESGRSVKQVILFVVVTLAGLWILQSIVIVTVTSSLQGIVASGSILLLVAKGIATLFSLVWNYVWYSRVVFKRKSI